MTFLCVTPIVNLIMIPNLHFRLHTNKTQRHPLTNTSHQIHANTMQQSHPTSNTTSASAKQKAGLATPVSSKHYAAPKFHHSPAPASLPPPPFLKDSSSSPLGFLFAAKDRETPKESAPRAPVFKWDNVELPKVELRDVTKEQREQRPKEGITERRTRNLQESRSIKETKEGRSNGSKERTTKDTKERRTKESTDKFEHKFERLKRPTTTDKRKKKVVPKTILKRETPVEVPIDETEAELRRQAVHLMELLKLSPRPNDDDNDARRMMRCS